MEIERKWLLVRVPTVEPKTKYFIEQFYLSMNPEIRLRRCTPNGPYENKVPYRLTVKGSGDLARFEAETAISGDFYNDVLDYANCEPIQKHWLVYPVDGYDVEVNVVLGKKGLIYAEVEFETEEEAKNYIFPWPELVEREVTYDPKFKMKNIWEGKQ